MCTPMPYVHTLIKYSKIRDVWFPGLDFHKACCMPLGKSLTLYYFVIIIMIITKSSSTILTPIFFPSRINSLPEVSLERLYSKLNKELEDSPLASFFLVILPQGFQLPT